MCAILSLFTLIFISIPLALGFVIITPSSANGWRNSGPQLLEWQLAGSDPATFAVVLTSVDGIVNQLLAADVDSNRWSTVVNPPSGGWPVGTSFTFRVNFVKDANDISTIYASSQLFNIEPVVPVDITTSPAPVPSTPTPTSSTISSLSATSTTPVPYTPTPTWSTISSATSTSSGTLSTSSTSIASSSSTSSSLTTKSTSSSTTSSARSTTSPANKTTTLTPSPHSTSPPYSTSHFTSPQYSTSNFRPASTSTALKAGSSAKAASVPHAALWRTFR